MMPRIASRMCYKGIEVDALGALSTMPHIGINMLKQGGVPQLGRDAVTVSVPVPAVVVTVAPETSGATVCFCEGDR